MDRNLSIMLFGVWLMTCLMWHKHDCDQRKDKEIQIAVRDSVNTANRIVIEKLRGDSIEYSERFKKMLNENKK